MREGGGTAESGDSVAGPVVRLSGLHRRPGEQVVLHVVVVVVVEEGLGGGVRVRGFLAVRTRGTGVLVQMPTIPTAFHPAWALVTVDILEYIENARTAGDTANVDRGLKWYLCAPQLFLRRCAKTGKLGYNVLTARFTAWREGRRDDLVQWWRHGSERGAALQRRSQPAPDSSAEDRRAYPSVGALSGPCIHC